MGAALENRLPKQDFSPMLNAIDQGPDAIVAHVRDQMEAVIHLTGISQVLAACTLRAEVSLLSRRMLADAYRETPSLEKCKANKQLREAVTNLLVGNDELPKSVQATLEDAAFQL